MPPSILTEEQIQDIQLATLRASIDEIDARLVEYLNKRAYYTDIVQERKREWFRPALDQGREAVVLSRVPKRFHGVYAAIFADAKKEEGWTGI